MRSLFCRPTPLQRISRNLKEARLISRTTAVSVEGRVEVLNATKRTLIQSLVIFWELYRGGKSGQIDFPNSNNQL
jgi:hypothetical protein